MHPKLVRAARKPSRGIALAPPTRSGYLPGRVHQLGGYTLIVLAAFLWGGSSSVGKSLMQAGVPTLMLMEARPVLAAIVVVTGLAIFRRADLRLER